MHSAGLASGSHEKPTILIVPGSFCPVVLYAGVLDYLKHYGYEVQFAHYPSIGRRDPLPPATMEDDAAYVSCAVERLANAGKSIFMVTHSYGGIPGTEGSKTFSKKERTAAGKPGGIVHVLYVTSLVARIGESLVDLMGSEVTPFLLHESGYMAQEIHGSAKISYSDVPESEGLECAKLMPNHSAISFRGKATFEGYKNFPISYLICTEDKCVFPELQQRIVDMLVNEAGVNVDVHKIQSGHCPNISRPKTLGFLIRRIVGEDV